MRTMFTLMAAFCLGLIATSGKAAKITTFRVGLKGTYPIAINNTGQITGSFGNACCAIAGFVRDAGGGTSPFHVSNMTETLPGAIDSEGNISGEAYGCHAHSRRCIWQAFVRAPDGTIVPFRVAKGLRGETRPCCVKSFGWIAGTAYTNNGPFAFLRDPSGDVTPISVPESSFTYALGMNSSEEITGFYCPSTCDLTNGYIRTSDGRFTTFSVSGFNYTGSISINSDGVTTGSSSNGQQQHGFVRDASGDIQTFDVPGADSTIPRSINNDGTITGTYVIGSVGYGFVRTSSGEITTFAPNGASDTYVTGMNQKGVIVGYYIDQSQNDLGFIRTP